MFYDRKVKYFSYYESGERIRGSGFVKLEVRDELLRIELAIRGLGAMRGSYAVLLVQGDREIPAGEVSLREGSGNLRHECHMQFPYEELTAIRIPLAAGREVLCRLSEQFPPVRDAESQNKRKNEGQEERQDARAAELPQTVRDREWEDKRKNEGKEEGKEARQDKGQEERQDTRAAELPRAVRGTESQDKRREVRRTESSEGEEEMHRKAGAAARGDRSPVIRLQEDKWSQLCAIYPHIFPFRDERDYLSITPSDFVLLPSADYTAAHNSFLLHGYYNYQHLVLTRVERRGEILYYLGVPGRYYEKEKQVAVMFNFESFECAEEPAEQGDFGYYMMRVKL